MSNNFRAFEFGIRIATGFAADPITGKLGEIYLDNALNTPKFYNGTVWIDMLRTKFDDSVFRIYDNINPANKIAFEVAAITGGNTRTIIMPDNDVNLGDMVSKAASSTDNAIVRFDGVYGNLIKNSGAILDDADNLTGLASLAISSATGITGLSVTKSGPTGQLVQLFLTNPANSDNILEVSTAGFGNHISTPNSASIATETLRIQSGNQTGSGGSAANSGDVSFNSGTSNEANTGSVGMFSGATTFAGATSGQVYIYSGDADSNTGLIQINSGDSTAGTSGAVNILSGLGLGTGLININTGIASFGNSGALNVSTGNAFNASGNMTFITGTVTDVTGSDSGNFDVTTGNTIAFARNSGRIHLTTGNSTHVGSGDSGGFQVLIGDSTFANGGAIGLFSGSSLGSGFGGSISLIAGNSVGGTGGSINITSGIGPTTGDIFITSNGFLTATAVMPITISSSAGLINITANNDLNLSSTGGAISATTPTFLYIKAASGVKRSTDGGITYVDEFYVDSTTLLGSQTDTTASNFTFLYTDYAGLIVDYKIKEATTNNVRTGTLYVATDGVTAQISDTFAETASVDVTWIATIVGFTVELQYTTANANNKTMRADVKKIRN